MRIGGIVPQTNTNTGLGFQIFIGVELCLGWFVEMIKKILLAWVFLTTESETPPFMALEMKKSYILKGSHSRYFTIGGRDYREIMSTNTIFSMCQQGEPSQTRIPTFGCVHYRRWAKKWWCSVEFSRGPLLTMTKYLRTFLRVNQLSTLEHYVLKIHEQMSIGFHGACFDF